MVVESLSFQAHKRYYRSARYGDRFVLRGWSSLEAQLSLTVLMT
jgi:hypothetical protein